jgi:hypothetical protein
VADFFALNAYRGPQARGFIQDWLFLAPIPLAPGESGARGLERQQLPDEARLRPRSGDRVQVGSQQLVWRTVRSPDSVLDFNSVLGPETEYSAGYAVCYLESDRARDDLSIQVASDDQAKVYLNGAVVHQSRSSHPLRGLETVGPVALRQGQNVLVFKVVNEILLWEGCLRFVDAEGRPAQGIRVRLTPEPE